MDDLQLAWPFLIPIVGTICTFAYIIVLTLSKARVRELEVRERIAHDRAGPGAAARSRSARLRPGDARPTTRNRYRSPGRHRRAGVTLMGVGFGLMMLIGVAGGAMNEGIGVGGFFVIMGLAFFINSLFEHPDDQYQPAPPRPRRSRPDDLGASTPRITDEFRSRYTAALRIDTDPSRRYRPW